MVDEVDPRTEQTIFGPFHKYTEVLTSRGTFGLQPGQRLDISASTPHVETATWDGDDEVWVFPGVSADSATREGEEPSYDSEQESADGSFEGYTHGSEGVDDGPEQTVPLGEYATAENDLAAAASESIREDLGEE